jgi:hypothetical protein
MLGASPVIGFMNAKGTSSSVLQYDISSRDVQGIIPRKKQLLRQTSFTRDGSGTTLRYFFPVDNSSVQFDEKFSWAIVVGQGPVLDPTGHLIYETFQLNVARGGVIALDNSWKYIHVVWLTYGQRQRTRRR